MAGSGAALRLHEFKEFLHCDHLERQRRASRQGRDTHGQYPGQLGRVHPAQSKDHGYEFQSGRPQLLSVTPIPPQSNHRDSSFDLRTLRAVSVSFQPELRGRPIQTTYQEHFGLQSNLQL